MNETKVIQSRKIIFGDIHGCIEELVALFNNLNLQKDDELFFIGDLIDRGPDSAAVVKYVHALSLTNKLILITGNHEEKFLRYIHHLETKSGLEKSMKGTDEFPELLKKLSDKEINFIRKSYYTYHLPENNALLLHGGLTSQVNFLLPATYQYSISEGKKHKGIELITKTRYLNTNGKFVSLNEEKPEDVFWAESYGGKYGHIFFGHQPFMKDQPTEFAFATGLDTGCVFGGHLSACILENESYRYVSVPAKKIYYNKHQQYE